MTVNMFACGSSWTEDSKIMSAFWACKNFRAVLTRECPVGHTQATRAEGTDLQNSIAAAAAEAAAAEPAAAAAAAAAAAIRWCARCKRGQRQNRSAAVMRLALTANSRFVAGL